MTDPRELWHPAFLQVFGVFPWQMRDLFPDEITAMTSYLEKMTGRG